MHAELLHTVQTHNQLTSIHKVPVLLVYIRSRIILSFLQSRCYVNHARLDDYCEGNNDGVLRVRRWRRQWAAAATAAVAAAMATVNDDRQRRRDRLMERGKYMQLTEASMRFCKRVKR